MLILHPVEIVGLPAAEDECHVLDVIGHQSSAAAIFSHLHTGVVLGKLECEACELIVLIIEAHLHVERLISVNLVRGPFSIGIDGAYMGGIDGAVALVAISVDSIHRGIASLGFSLEDMPVGLHDVKLRAKVASWII